MTDDNSRREFLRRGAVAAAAGIVSGGTAAAANGQDPPPTAESPTPPPENANTATAEQSERLPEKFQEYSRYRPSYGGPPESDNYMGKLVPGLRGSGLPPVPVEAPDLGKLPWKMVDGVKEFHIYCEHVRRELLPGNWMDFFGYNGSMPGPTIEAEQGDRVRFVVHNHLPEPTSVHWHGLELPVEEDGVPGLTQNPIPPGETYVYEYDLHQAGTFFYHSHMPMQEAFGMVGFFIIHPAVAFDPPVDRDFLLLFQNFRIDPNQTIPDSMAMEWSWHTINGRSGPYTTPMVCRHGERVRIRILDFSPMQHHPVHIHGHTFWVTGHEGTRIPKSAWIPRNTELIAVAQASDFEFIAFNPGDWIMHCHMVHHMMNHMVRQVGPRIREDVDVARYRGNLDSRPQVKFPHTDPGYQVPGYPQMMQGQEMTPAEMQKINNRRETRGMRPMWHMGVKGLMTVVRVLPDDLYDLVMHSDEKLQPGQVFEEIKRRRGKTEGKEQA
ncbi:multicopper oxidase domain-containing protein [Candidatus Laterigemmans baculatus]|uniref:multicopper oxidase domain-containing protein n=1 Tax=Candidatus Laterigemmans baculatus TaxID=2770505 RepID=UPI0013DC56BF|nr:copper oxidase [Candidatus Laterigemmans baculatus]